MKVGKRARNNPDRECVTCGMPLEKDGYELCADCERELDVHRGRRLPDKPQNGGL